MSYYVSRFEYPYQWLLNALLDLPRRDALRICCGMLAPRTSQWLHEFVPNVEPNRVGFVYGSPEQDWVLTQHAYSAIVTIEDPEAALAIKRACEILHQRHQSLRDLVSLAQKAVT